MTHLSRCIHFIS